MSKIYIKVAGAQTPSSPRPLVTALQHTSKLLNYFINQCNLVCPLYVLHVLIYCASAGRSIAG